MNFRIQPRFLYSFWKQITIENLHFFVKSIPRHIDNLHSIKQRRVQSLQHIRCTNKQHLRQINRRVNKVICKRIILLRIQYLQQRRPWIPMMTRLPYLIDLINQNHRVIHLTRFQRIDNLTRHSSHIRPSEPLQRTRVPIPTKRNPHKFPIQRLSDWFPNTRFSYTRRPYKTQDLALHRIFQLAYRDELQDSVLDIIHAVVMVIKNLLGRVNIEILRAGDAVW